MSELKAHRFLWPSEIPLDDSIGKLYYLKSEADKVIAELKEERRWRKCSEEKPKENDYYLVTNGDAVYYDVFFEYGYYSEQDEEWQWEHNGKWKYWMPLPKAPEEAK